MTRREALSILFQAGSRDIRGSGLGIRSAADESRSNVAKAIQRLYKEVYGHEMTEREGVNLGMVLFVRDHSGGA